jgi:hypothetical protein
MDANAFRAELRQFTGSEEFYPHFLKGFRYTEGVRYLVQKLNCHWLVDAIASWQSEALKDPWLREFQLWELYVKDGKGKLVCLHDLVRVAFSQEIPTTDFPLDYVRLYVEGGTLMLPGEH